MELRTSVHLSESMTMRLTAAATRTGVTKSELIEAALDRFLEPDSASEHFAILTGLAALNDQIDRLSADLKTVNEVVAHHARFHLTITPPLTRSEQNIASLVGSERFEEFAAQVGRRVERGTSLLQETMNQRAVANKDRFARDLAAGGARTNYNSSEPDRRPSDTVDGATRSTPGYTERFVGAVRPPTLTHSWGPEPAVAGVIGGPALIVRVFVPFAVGYYLSYLFRTINALIAAPLTLELGLDAGDLGLLTSAYFLTFAAAQIPIGIFLDRYGPRRIQSVLLVVASVGAALFAVSDNLLMLFLGRALLGLGAAASMTAGLKALVLSFPKDRLPVLNGLMVLVGGLGAVTATSPTQLLLTWIGWRTLFALLAVLTASCSALIYLLVPESASTTPTMRGTAMAGLREIYTNLHFWRLAPLSATSVGTAWALHGLWAAQWLTDVDGLDRTAVVQHLFVMAAALSLGALMLGVLADRIRRYGIGTEALLAVVGLLFIAIQSAIILRCPMSSYVLWGAVAVVGAATVLSYAILATYFPKELAGRANAALNVFHIGGAFVLQSATGVVLEQWRPVAGHYPAIAYQTPFALNLTLLVGAWIWFSFSWMFPPSTAVRKRRVAANQEPEKPAGFDRG
ncbi:MFS transporter [Bradyrhizobium sp. 142]|uniref:MFS transporter n=1 Tax=Bradyrhizobium sp. 142 TaxID=2782618 RepID=UPI001FF841E2|nr:MFS transporter [Bradyrhizobium sp. 142]MCK1732338.1 MFS transporter [Bradyrhizobium sp. 142]